MYLDSFGVEDPREFLQMHGECCEPEFASCNVGLLHDVYIVVYAHIGVGNAFFGEPGGYLF